jgi:ribosomal protein S12 methylthiotransferase
MQRRLREGGFILVEDPGAADVVVVNTCSFIRSATEESLDVILDLADPAPGRARPPKIVVAGCMPSRYGKDLEAELQEASAFVPCAREDDIVEVILALEGFDAPEPLVSVHGTGRPDIAAPALGTGRPAAGPFSPFAYVKLSEGCDRFCSYCTIPLIRGPYHSHPFSAIDAEVARLVAGGTGEVVLIAQDSGRWGEDLPGRPSLSVLLEALASRYRDTWFRVMYLQPEGVTEGLLGVMASFDNICNYLDIPLQHVDASILAAMNRKGSHKAFAALIGFIRSKLPNVALRTTLIAGFPGEGEEAHQALCAFVEEAAFDYVGVFPYSREEGTPAAGMPSQIDEETKLARAQELRDIADAIGFAKVAARRGQDMDVLVCGREEDGQLYGRAQCQAPEVDGVTYLAAGTPGEIVRVTIGDTLLYEMEGV